MRVRWWLMAASILMLFAAASGLRFLTFNTDTRVFFSEQNPQLQALEALENTYTENQNVLFVIAPQDGDVFTRESLAAAEEWYVDLALRYTIVLGDWDIGLAYFRGTGREPRLIEKEDASGERDREVSRRDGLIGGLEEIRLIVFGATSGTGQQILQRGLENGHCWQG